MCYYAAQPIPFFRFAKRNTILQFVSLIIYEIIELYASKLIRNIITDKDGWKLKYFVNNSTTSPYFVDTH